MTLGFAKQEYRSILHLMKTIIETELLNNKVIFMYDHRNTDW